jgi:hypothetical protein
LDGLVALFDLANRSVGFQLQSADAVLTGPYILVELYPVVLVVFALRKRLDAPRWAVAIFVFVAEMLQLPSPFCARAAGSPIGRLPTQSMLRCFHSEAAH